MVMNFLDRLLRKPDPSWIIESKDLKPILKDVFLLDVRYPEEFEEEKIEGSTLIPLPELESRAEKELQKDSNIVVYCKAGVRSMDALYQLKTMGFKNVRSLKGGIMAWKDAGF